MVGIIIESDTQLVGKLEKHVNYSHKKEEIVQVQLEEAELVLSRLAQ
jgi:hypothetical protein